MLRFKEWYAKYGIRYNSQFISPTVIKPVDLILPLDTNFHWYKVSNVPITINISLYGLTSGNRIYYKYIYKNNGNSLGDYKYLTVTPEKLINEYRIKNTRLVYLRSEDVSVSLAPKDILLMDYSPIISNCKYSPLITTPYYKWYNTLSTVVNNILPEYVSSERKNVVVFDIPEVLPTRVELDRFAGQDVPNARLLDVFPNYKYLNVLELWRLLDKDNHNKSILGKIPSTYANNTILLLTAGDNIVPINLGVLLTLLKDSDTSTPPIYKLISGNNTIAQKHLYVLLHNMVNVELIPKMHTPLVTSSSPNNMVATNTAPDVEVLVEHIDKQAADEEEDASVDADIANKAKIKEDIDDIDATISNIDAVAVAGDYKKYKNVSDVVPVHTEVLSAVSDNVEELKKNNVITKKAAEVMVGNLKAYMDTRSPFPNDDEPLRDMLNPDKDNIALSKEDVSITDINTVFNKDQNAMPLQAITKKYIETQSNRDIVRAIHSIHTTGNIVVGHTVDRTENIMGTTDTHSIAIKGIDDSTANVKLILPVMNPDGTFKLSGNTYLMRRQRADLPIRKIDYNWVVLSTYYGKMSVIRSRVSSSDGSHWLYKQLISKYGIDPKLKELIAMPVDNQDALVPKDYELVARRIKSFKYDDTYFMFEYAKRGGMIKDRSKPLSSIESNGKYVLVGIKDDVSYVMDGSSGLYKLVNGKYEIVGDMLSLLGIDRAGLPLEYVTTQIYKEHVPVGLLLSYYFGLETLLTILNTKYTTVAANKRATLTSNQYVLTFMDMKLVVDRDYGLSDMIIGGLTRYRKEFKTLNINYLNNKQWYIRVFNVVGLSMLISNEIKMMEDAFLDPIAISELKRMGKPTVFKALLIHATELLLNDAYTDPRDITDMTIKGYDRIAGMIYKELIKGIKEHTNRSSFGRSRITVNPYSILNTINADSTVVLLDDLNPMASIKQAEEITYLGAGGRNKEGMSVDTRIMTPNDIGIVSEHTKDSGDVGITAGLSGNPNIVDIRGNVRKLTDDDAWASRLSTNGLLQPFTRYDDPKRANFSSIMASHIIPISNMRAPYIRTGYESIIANKSLDKFVVSATDDGVVSNVSPTEVEVTYKNNTKSKYKLYSWTSKEEAGSCYTHYVVTNLVVGDKLIKDDTITYDKAFFEPDIFNPKRVIYKSGTYTKVALRESFSTHEDSTAISTKFIEKLSTTVSKTRSIIVKATDNIIGMLKVGSAVSASDVLFTISDNVSINKDMDERTYNVLQGIKANAPKAKYNGTISKINIYYNSDIKDVTESLAEAINKSDKVMKNLTGYTGRVNSSYSISGNALLPGFIEIKVYIDVKDGLGIGDKVIFGNQLKCTVGDIIMDDIRAEDGTVIDALFSGTSISNRIVNSPDLIGTTSTLLDLVTKKAINIYYGRGE